MTATRSLHFCSSNRAWALGLHRALADGVREKILLAFKDIEAEANAFSHQEYMRLSSRPSWNGDVDMGDIAETAIDQGIGRYEDLNFVQGQMQALSIAGFYHLWERTLKEFLVRTLSWEGLKEGEAQEIRKAGFDKLISISTELGYSVREESFFHRLEVVNLVANTCKHGEGSSFARLLEKAPELLNGPHSIGSRLFAPSPDDLWIDAGTITKLESAIDQFWHAMPEHLYIPSAWYERS